MTSRQVLDVAAGYTHASSVIADVSCNDVEFGTLTREFEPLNDSAPPNLPAGVQFAFERVPVFAFPDESAVVVPDPSSNAYAATRPAGPAACVVAALGFE